jgi:hypothetical protein
MKAVTRLGTVPSDTQKRGFPARFLKKNKKCKTWVKRLLCACVMCHPVLHFLISDIFILNIAMLFMHFSYFRKKRWIKLTKRYFFFLI